jgi:hypothetical protein
VRLVFIFGIELLAKPRLYTFLESGSRLQTPVSSPKSARLKAGILRNRPG